MNFDNQPPYNYTSTPEHAYWLALETIKSPEGYYSFYYRLDQIESVEQCLANLDIEQYSLNRVIHHDPRSFLRNIRQTKVDLLWHKYSELKSVERQKFEEKEKYKNKRNFCNKICGTLD